MTDTDAAAARFTEIVRRLDEAFAFCRSIGLAPEQGRFGLYRRDLLHLIEFARAGGAESLSAGERAQMQESLTRYRVALSEGRELGNMLPYLDSCDHQRLTSKLRTMFDGQALPVDEQATSNTARNIQFELTFASMLWRAGFAPILGDNPDVRVDLGRTLLFECKRIFSPAKVSVRLKEAGEQLRRDLRNHPASSLGIVVISLSRLLNPSGDAFRITDREEGKGALGRWLEDAARAARPSYQELFRRSIAVTVFFYAESDFLNLEAGAYVHGMQFVADLFIPPSASYGPALTALRSGLDTLTHG